MVRDSIHSSRRAVLGLLLGLVFSLGCGPKEVPPAPAAAMPAAPPAVKSEPVPTAGPASPAASPAPALATGAKPSAPAVAPEGKAPSATPGAAAAPPVPEPKPAAPAPQPKPEPKPAAAALNPISDPGGEVAVKPTKAGLSRAGTASCKMCHKVQFASWSESAHAKRNPPLDCESCHGAGSEYKAMGVMKDPAKARAAGLVSPSPAFCTTCHKHNWNDGLLKKAHAHKT